MPFQPLMAILLSSILHPTWNLILKQSRFPVVCLWTGMLGSSALLLPIVLAAGRPTSIAPAAWLALGASALFTAGYFRLLAETYRQEDLSRVYPFTRGLPTVLLLGAEAIFLGHRPSAFGILGVALIGFGIYVLHLRTLRRSDLLEPLRAFRDPVAVLIGLNALAITGYGLMNKLALDHGVPPLMVFAVTNFAAALVLGAGLATQVPAAYRATDGREAVRWIAVGLLEVVTYGLVLWAMVRSPVSYVEAVRQVGVIYGALFGVYVLREPFGRYRITGSALVLVGTVLIVWAG